MAQSNGRGGVSRVERKLKESIAAGNFYEAHQMYRTLYSRYSAQNRHKEVQDLMQSGATLFFSNEETGSAVDLCLLLLDSLESSKAEVTEELIATIGSMHQKIDPSHPQHENFEVKAVTWTTHTEGVPRSGHKKLRGIFAHTLWNGKQYNRARQHFLYSDDGANSGEMILEFAMLRGSPKEEDLFITQFVLQLLCIRSKQTANDAFASYTLKLPGCSKHPFSMPLLNFVFFLLAAIDSPKLVTFTALCEQYKPSLNRDPTYFKYLERIGENFFGVVLPKQKKKKGLLDNLLQGLMDGSVGEEEGGEYQPSTSSVMTEEDLD